MKVMQNTVYSKIYMAKSYFRTLLVQQQLGVVTFLSSMYYDKKYPTKALPDKGSSCFRLMVPPFWTRIVSRYDKPDSMYHPSLQI